MNGGFVLKAYHVICVFSVCCCNFKIPFSIDNTYRSFKNKTFLIDFNNKFWSKVGSNDVCFFSTIRYILFKSDEIINLCKVLILQNVFFKMYIMILTKNTPVMILQRPIHGVTLNYCNWIGTLKGKWYQCFREFWT